MRWYHYKKCSLNIQGIIDFLLNTLKHCGVFFTKMSQNLSIINPPVLSRTIEVNRYKYYCDLLDSTVQDLPVGSTALFEWSLDPFFPVNHINDSDKYIYNVGYIIVREGGVRDFVYENKLGDIKELKKEFTVCFI